MLQNIHPKLINDTRKIIDSSDSSDTESDDLSITNYSNDISNTKTNIPNIPDKVDNDQFSDEFSDEFSDSFGQINELQNSEIQIFNNTSDDLSFDDK